MDVMQAFTRILFFCLAIASVGVLAQQGHGDAEVFRVDNKDYERVSVAGMKVSDAHTQLVNRYVLFVSSADGNCGGSVMACEGQHYFTTAKHCSVDDGGVLQTKFDLRYDGSQEAIEVDLKEHALSVEQSSDLTRIKLAKNHPIIALAIKEGRATNCSSSKIFEDKSQDVLALGRPGCLDSKAFSLSCKVGECPEEKVGIDKFRRITSSICYDNSLSGISGGPVGIVKDGEFFQIGVNSQDAWQVGLELKGTTVGPAAYGPLLFSPLPRIGGDKWKTLPKL